MEQTNNFSNLNLTLEEVEQRVQHLVQQGHADTYQLGWFYNYVVDRRLAEKGGFKDALDFFKKKVKVLSQSTLSLYGAVAREFTASACVKYGMYHLEALIAYEKAAGIQVDPNEPGPTPVEVPRKNGVVSKPFAECSVTELKLAVKHKREPSAPGSSEEEARLSHYRDTLARFLPENSRVRMNARAHRGKLLLSLKDISEDELEKLAEALLEFLPPLRVAA